MAPRLASLLILVLLALLVMRGARAQPAWSDPDAATRKQMAIQAFGDHFSIGQSPGNLAWYNDTFANNGNRWDFHVMYLSGGPPYPGAPSPWDRLPWWQYYSDFPTVVINNLQRLQKPMMPWFTFYAMAQGYPGEYGDCGATPKPPVCGGPAQATPLNAHDPVYMKSYFALFKTLMQKVGAFPTIPVVIHIEPDEWGHILLNGTYTWPNLNISTTFVYVGGSGHPDLVGFPDNIYGWARAFKKLRDTYAGKNALLICNPSGWDSTGSMSGLRFGAIMKQLAGDWEGAVFETGDRDKGSTSSPPFVDANGIPTISITGNFQNHVNWINDFHNVSGLPVFVWQAASGNTVYRTCNQQDKHYMDNLMETLLGGYPADKTWLTKYVNAGCFGWMFNPGQGFSTHVDDTANDGITNPAVISGSQGLTSTYADDDGGYTRLRGQAYYAAPYSLLGIYPGTSVPTTTTAAASTAAAVTSAAAAAATNAATTNSATAAATSAATVAVTTTSQASTVAVTSAASTTAVTSTAFASGGASGTSTAATSTTASAASTTALTSTAVDAATSTNAVSTAAAAANPSSASAGSSKGGSSKLSSGAIAGIVIGIVIVLAVIVGVLVYLLAIRKPKEDFVIRS